MELLMVTGLSGAGKSQAVNCLEDIGYYCIDNIPPRLMADFIQLVSKSPGQLEKVAFVVDIRGGLFFDDLRETLQELRRSGVEMRILFIEASDAVLIRRYKETRRTHPLDRDGDVAKAIRTEREKLAYVRDAADIVIDSSGFKVAELYEEIKRLLLPGEESAQLSVTVESFGYKFGVPQEADWVLDVRFIPNPYYVPSLKNLTGRSKKIREYVLRFPESSAFADEVAGGVVRLAPHYIKQGKYHLCLALGCTGGRHRSVVMADEIAARLRAAGISANIIHRELESRK